VLAPWVNYDGVGLRNAFTYSLRGRYEQQVLGVDLAVTGDYLSASFDGQTSSWDGYVGHPILTSGFPASASLDVRIFTLSGDVGVSQALLGETSPIQVGTRFQWTQYSDSFKLENTRTSLSHTKGRSYGTFGVGLVGLFDVARLSGMMYTDSLGSFRPVVTVVATVGKGGGMRSFNWEAWLSIFQTGGESRNYFYDYVPMPQITAEIGWIRYNFVQTIEQEEMLIHTGAVSRDGNANYSLNIPMFRGVLSF
jgi:hypothetical protein